MKPVVRWSLWNRRLSVVGWSVGISAYILIKVLVYRSISSQAKAFNNVLYSLPATTRSLFTDSADILSPVGYLSAKLYYLILPLLFTMLAVGLSHALMSCDEEAGTLELLLACPVSRGRLWLA